MKQAIRKLSQAGIALLVAVATLFSGLLLTTPAHAELIPEGPGLWHNPGSAPGWGSWGVHGPFLGIDHWENGVPMYCIETGAPMVHFNGEWQETDDPNSLIAATLIERNKGNGDALTQAAVAYALKLHFDRGNAALREAEMNAGFEGGISGNQVRDKANQLWNEAANNTPQNATVEAKYTSGMREGTISVFLKNSSGGYVGGIPFRVVSSGPVAFNTTSGTTNADGNTIINWRATGNGNVSIQVQYNARVVRQLTSTSQDMLKSGDPRNANSNTATFRVVNNFQPTVTTEASNRIVEAGQPVIDNVTSGVEGSDPWVDNTTVTANGYYYVGTAKDVLKEIAVNKGETPADYLARVNKEVGKPAAHAAVTFTEAKQTKQATALNDLGQPYLSPERGLYGSWLWIIDKNTQAASAKEYIKGSYVDAYGKVAESSLFPSTTSVWSEVAEPHANTDADVRDVIHIANLPKDFGQSADPKYGFGNDNTKLYVDVYWSGSGTGVKAEDEKYRPSTETAPADDAHHKKLGTYVYDMAQLMKAKRVQDGRLDIKVGGGKHGNPTADGSHFSIKADKTGFYTFVARYDGCDRVKAFTTPYNDQFESTFVTRDVPTISLRSDASPERVKVGEPFRDTATISGSGNADAAVDEGSYVMFDAYNPTYGKPDVSVGKLVDSDKVVLTSGQVDDLRKGRQISVQSKEVTTNRAGKVYWRATLYTADGRVLATHELGVKSETTTVRGGGVITSESQKQGAVGGAMWDIITVGDEPNGQDAGNIPDGSHVEVSVYKHEGQTQATKAQLVETRKFAVETDKLGPRPGSYSFKATMSKTYPAAGQYYWVAKLIAPDGEVLAEGKYGEDSERTSVQAYDTDVAKKWLSDNNSEYSTKTIDTFDVLNVRYFDQWGDDMDGQVRAGQTAKGTVAHFTISKDENGQLVKAADVPDMTIPRIPVDRETNDYLMRVKSATVQLDGTPGKYYYDLKVTNSQDAANLKRLVGEESDGTVFEAPARVERESFNVVKVSSTAAEPVVTTDMQHIQDVLHVEGTLPRGSAYQVEVWQVDEQNVAVKKLGETKKVTLSHDVTDADITAPVMDNPLYKANHEGTLQFRHKVWTPDNKGGKTTIDHKVLVVDDDWKTAQDYEDSPLLVEGDSVASERFEVIHITTKAAADNGQTSRGVLYVDATNTAAVYDTAKIEGKLPAGYALSFDLYAQGAGDETTDRMVGSTTAHELAAGATDAVGDKLSLDQSGRYYWVAQFAKVDGSAFGPDGQTKVATPRRVKAESFEAIRVTTATAKWSAEGGTAHDQMTVEGNMPEDATVVFNLKRWSDESGAVATEETTLAKLGYQTGSAKPVSSEAVTVPEASDYYFSELVHLPDVPDTPFHEGGKVPHEATRAINATTSTRTEINVGDAISDDTNLENISYDKDIRPDFADKELSASWEVWSWGAGDVDSDKLLATLDATPLENHATEVSSPKWVADKTGVYYFRVRIMNGDKLIAYGKARETAESFRVVSSKSLTYPVHHVGDKVSDKVTITGPVLAGTVVSWRLFTRSNEGIEHDTEVANWADMAADNQETEPAPAAGEPADANTETADTATQTDGLDGWGSQGAQVVISKEQADKAAKDGSVTVESPEFTAGKTGRYYFVHSLTAPTRGSDGMPTGEPALLPFFTDAQRQEHESGSVIKVTTKRSAETVTVGDKIHDTALIEGYAPAGMCVEFEYWKQSKDSVDKDKLVSTTECVPVPEGATSVDSPEIVASKPGTFYFRERLYGPKTPGKPTPPVVHYGKPRIPDETVKVKKKPLPKTGVAMMGVALLAGGAGMAGVVVGATRRRQHGAHKA